MKTKQHVIVFAADLIAGKQLAAQFRVTGASCHLIDEREWQGSTYPASAVALLECVRADEIAAAFAAAGIPCVRFGLDLQPLAREDAAEPAQCRAAQAEPDRLAAELAAEGLTDSAIDAALVEASDAAEPEGAVLDKPKARPTRKAASAQQ